MHLALFGPLVWAILKFYHWSRIENSQDTRSKLAFTNLPLAFGILLNIILAHWFYTVPNNHQKDLVSIVTNVYGHIMWIPLILCMYFYCWTKKYEKFFEGIEDRTDNNRAVKVAAQMD